MSINVQGRLCHLIVTSRQEDQFDEKDLTNKLRSDDINSKRTAMKTIIRCLSSGIPMPSLFLEVINHVSKNNDHYLKKLWFLFWEMMPKIGNDGEPLPEVILACDSFLKDLTHPNEFLRGSVLRFMSKVREPIVLQALFNYVIEGLKHREPYVRRNAVLAIFSIYKNFPNLIGHVPEIINSYLERETSMPCKRNAFIALLHIDQERALNYLVQRIDTVVTFGETLQLTVVELIVKVCRRDPYLRSRFIRCVYSLLNSESPAVRFEAANTLIILTSLPSAIKEVSKCYVEIVSGENDINVSLVVLGRLNELIKSTPNNKTVLGDTAVDMLRMLVCNDLSVRKEVLRLVTQLLSQRNISQLIMMLKNEFMRCSSDKTEEVNDSYKELLIMTFKTCCYRFGEMVELILPTLADQLSISSESVSNCIMDLIRSNFNIYSNHQVLLNQLFLSFWQIRYPSSIASATWLICEFSTTADDIQTAFSLIMKLFTDIVSACSSGENEESDLTSGMKDEPNHSATRASHVLKDGSYITQSALASSKQTDKGSLNPSILAYIDADQLFAVSSICASLSKLVKRLESAESLQNAKNSLCAEAMLSMVSVLCYLEKSGKMELADRSEIGRIESSITLLLESPLTDESSYDLFTNQFRNSFALSMSTYKDGLLSEEKNNHMADTEISNNFIDSEIAFRFLTNSSNSANSPIKTDGQMSEYMSSTEPFSVKKEISCANQSIKVFQLTGMADVVYAEAQIEINHYTVWLEVSVVNQTPDTLQNFSLELAVIGDMTVINRPQSSQLAPNSTLNISTSVRMSSLQNGAIFGSLVYDTRGALNDRCYVVLNEIRIDLIDYIHPSFCSDDEFRRLWSEFEWENKIMVNTNITDLKETLEHMLSITRMKCLTSNLNYDLGFISANLYAKSIFGDAILANLSIENSPFSSEITGHVRIRSMTQAIAVSFGERINAKQRK